MSNVNFGFIVSLLSMAIFAITLFFGATLFAGHVALAILCACLFGIWAGIFIIEQS